MVRDGRIFEKKRTISRDFPRFMIRFDSRERDGGIKKERGVGIAFFLAKKFFSFENTFDAEHFFLNANNNNEGVGEGEGEGGGREGGKGTMSGKSVVLLCLVGKRK